MEKIFTVGFNESPDLKSLLGFELILVPQLHDENETEYHNFVTGLFKDREIEKLILDLSGSHPIRALKIAHHIRLSLDELGQSALIPILFTAAGKEDFERIISISENWGHILATKGAAFMPYNLAKIEISALTPLTPEGYKKQFLDIVNILPDETIGKHSIANQWGAFAMDKAAKTNALTGTTDLINIFHRLYFKFILAYQFDYSLLKTKLKIVGHFSIGEANTINAKGKKILLIDDEADKGWELVLRKVFKTNSPADFQVISERVADYESFSPESKKILDGDFDLYLLDLRLNGVQEEDTKKIEDFSGTKVLQKIKENKGNQVVVFTASNKAWNIKLLLDLGADAYYIKESPEYKFTSKESEVNYGKFKKGVEKLLKRGYLKEIYKIHKKAIDFIAPDKPKRTSDYQSFYDRAESSLEIAFELLKSASKDEKYLNFAYLTYYQILEDYTNLRENFEFINKSECYVDNGNTKVITQGTTGKSEWLIEYIRDRNGNYFKVATVENDYKVESLAKISFVLAFKHHKDNTYLKSFGKIHHLRNTKAAHGGGAFVTIPEIKEILGVVELFLTNP